MIDLTKTSGLEIAKIQGKNTYVAYRDGEEFARVHSQGGHVWGVHIPAHEKQPIVGGFTSATSGVTFLHGYVMGMEALKKTQQQIVDTFMVNLKEQGGVYDANQMAVLENGVGEPKVRQDWEDEGATRELVERVQPQPQTAEQQAAIEGEAPREPEVTIGIVDETGGRSVPLTELGKEGGRMPNFTTKHPRPAKEVK